MKKCRNILLIICVVLLIYSFVGCAKDIAETEQPEVADNNELQSYSSEYELQAVQIDRLAKKMLEEGKISDTSELYLVNAYQRNIEYSYVHFHDYTYKVESEEDVCYPYEIYSMSVSDDGEITYYYTVLDYYVRSSDGEKVIYAGNEKDEVISKVEDLDTAMKLDLPYTCTAWEIPNMKLFGSGMDWYRVFERVWTKEQLDELRDPVTAVETLFHLRGGEGTLIYSKDGVEYFDLYNTALVRYRFANGDEVSYLMMAYMDNPNTEYDEFDYWRPVYCTEKDDQLYPELKGLTKYYERRQKVYEIAYDTITFDELDKTSASYLFNYECNDAGGPFTEFSVFPEDDVTFYIISGFDSFIIKKDDQIYRVEDIDWHSMSDVNGGHGSGFKGCCDYDGDGQNEYVYVAEKARGTGYYAEDLYLIDISENGAKARRFELSDIESLLEEIIPEKCSLKKIEINGRGTYGNCLFFSCEDDKILFQYDVFPTVDPRGDPDVVGYVEGEIGYTDEGEFELLNADFFWCEESEE